MLVRAHVQWVMRYHTRAISQLGTSAIYELGREQRDHQHQIERANRRVGLTFSIDLCLTEGLADCDLASWQIFET